MTAARHGEATTERLRWNHTGNLASGSAREGGGASSAACETCPSCCHHPAREKRTMDRTPTQLTPRFAEAMAEAFRLHGTQRRKGSDVPYMTTSVAPRRRCCISAATRTGPSRGSCTTPPRTRVVVRCSRPSARSSAIASPRQARQRPRDRAQGRVQGLVVLHGRDRLALVLPSARRRLPEDRSCRRDPGRARRGRVRDGEAGANRWR